MFTLGDQKVSPSKMRLAPPLRRMVSLCFARASIEITVATRCISAVSQLAARPMACGKTVARPAAATPWSPSLHQSYAGMPRRSMPGVVFIICATFSSSVRRPIRSATRTSTGRSGFWKA